MSIRANDPVCAQAIFAISVTLLPSRILCVTNIPLIECNHKLFWEELYWEQFGGSVMSLRSTISEIYASKF